MTTTQRVSCATQHRCITGAPVSGPTIFWRSYMRFSALRRLVQVPLLLLLTTALLHAQNFRGGINGVVSDPSGAVVPGAAVELANSGTGITYKAVTSSGGEYEFLDLPIGKYVITVTAAGSTGNMAQTITVSVTVQ